MPVWLDEFASPELVEVFGQIKAEDLKKVNKVIFGSVAFDVDSLEDKYGRKYVRERTCEYIGDDVSGGCSVCCGWLDPACVYCPTCGAKVMRNE